MQTLPAVRKITDEARQRVETDVMKTNRLEFGTILVATDLQGSSSAALRYGQAIAAQHRSSLVILYVIDPIGYAFPASDPLFLETDLEARKELKRIEEEIRLGGIDVHSVVESGEICDRILQSVKDHNADLLILGTKAKTKAGRTALGTIARRLLAKCSCSILTVPPESDSLMSTAGRWRRVLVATDFSAQSLAAVQSAHKIVRGELLVIHASGSGGQQECLTCLEKLRFLAPVNESHTVPVEHIAAAGDIGKLISKHARRFRADLIVLGSPSSELSSEELSSSTVLEVISQATCPVLCIPALESAASLPALKEEVSA